MSPPSGAGDGGPEGRVRARRWLAGRLEDAPPRLGQAVEAALESLPDAETDEGPWDVLARGALRELQSVRPDTGDRHAALHLLAADALLTYAFQCAAEEGEDLEAMARRWGAGGRLGRALARARRAAASPGEDDPEGGTG